MVEISLLSVDLNDALNEPFGKNSPKKLEILKIGNPPPKVVVSRLTNFVRFVK